MIGSNYDLMFTAHAKPAIVVAQTINCVNLCHIPPMGSGIYLASPFLA